MSPLVIALVLLAALLHASWNAFLSHGKDRLWSVAVMCSTAGAVSLVFVARLPPPAAASWPFLLSSVVLEVVYCLLLVRAYETGELTMVYPIARGTSPLLVTMGAAVLVGERPSATMLVGIGLVSLGILAIALAHVRERLNVTLKALITGAAIAGFTLADGVGVRLSHQPESYAAWLFALMGAPMMFIYAAIRRRFVPRLPVGETLRAMAAGIASMAAYALILFALSVGPIGAIAALRETSILFALAIGRTVLGEPVTIRRSVSAAIIASGAAILSIVR